jgi:hypothetical protein
MANERYMNLIQQEVDGTNTSSERRRLREHLGENPEAKAIYDDLLRVTNMLNKVEKVDPPPNLKKTVLNSIQTDKYVTKKNGSRILGSIANLLPARRFDLRYAYIFGVGLLAGIVVYALFIERNTSPDLSRLYGTMGATNASLALETAGQLSINLAKVQGTITTRFAPGVVMAELQLKSEQPVEAVLEFDKSDISFSAIGRQNNSTDNLEIGENYLCLTNLGEGKYTILFDDRTEQISMINCKISSSGTPIFQESISTGKKGN